MNQNYMKNVYLVYQIFETENGKKYRSQTISFPINSCEFRDCDIWQVIKKIRQAFELRKLRGEEYVDYLIPFTH